MHPYSTPCFQGVEKGALGTSGLNWVKSYNKKQVINVWNDCY